jgi:PAS domain S-box-containing protein
MATILIVDDRPIERNVLTTILGYAGHRLLEAADGVEALKVVTINRPDLVIADVLMPNMDGFEFVRRLRADPVNATIPVIFYTASYLEREAKALAERCGVSQIIIKPSEPEQVFRAVNEALHVPPTNIPSVPVAEFQEQHLQILTAKAAEQSGRLDVLAPRLVALVELAQILATESDPMTLLQIFCDAARDITGATYAAVAVVDKVGETIQHVLTSGMSAEEIGRIEQLPMGKGLLHDVLIADNPIRINNLASDPRLAGFPPNHPSMRSFLGAPIMTAMQRYGSVYVTDKLGGMPFNDEDTQILSTLALQVGVAYENARRYGELQREMIERKRAQAELTALYDATSYLFKSDNLLDLGHQIAHGVVQEFKQSDCGILLVSRKQNQIVRLARTGTYDVLADQPLALNGPGLVPEAARTGKLVYAPDVTRDPRYVPNAAQTRSELVVPLRTGKGVIGVLDLQSIDLDAFSERDQRIIVAFAERAASAVEIMQLYEEVNQHAAELEWRVAQRTAELHRSKEHVEAILNNTSDAVIVLGVDYRILKVNPAFIELFGYQQDDIFGHPLIEFFAGEESLKLIEALSKVMADQPVKRIELPGHHQNGTEVRVDVGLSAVKDEQNYITNIVCTLADITERNRAEQELRQALEKQTELNELKTRFVSMVSHDFRTPLAIILSSAETLQFYSDHLDDEKKVERFGRIRNQVSRMVALLDDLLTINQADAGATPFNPIPISLDSFCRNIAEEFQSVSEMKHILTYSCSNEPGTVLADEKLLQRVLINLLTNAFKYSPEGSTVEFKLSFDEDNAVIRIKDSGIGIPEADQPYLFEAFQRAGNVGNIQGTGLGLAIVKSSIEAHGGKIMVESQIGIGTTFTVTIPRG